MSTPRTLLESPPLSNPRLSKTAVAGLVLAIVALALGMLGIYSPAGVLRYPVTKLGNGPTAMWVYGGTFIAPIVLGSLAGWLGVRALRRIEQRRNELYGDALGIFTLLIGLFAVIIGSVCTFAGLIWPSL